MIALGGHTYRIETMSALDAWELHRKVAPMASQAIYAISLLSGGDAANFAPALSVFGSAFAELKKADADYILRACLSHVTRRNDDGTWPATRIMVAGVLAFDDMSPFQLDALIFEVIKNALGDFMTELATYLPAEPVPVNAGVN